MKLVALMVLLFPAAVALMVWAILSWGGWVLAVYAVLLALFWLAAGASASEAGSWHDRSKHNRRRRP